MNPQILTQSLAYSRALSLRLIKASNDKKLGQSSDKIKRIQHQHE